MTMRTDDRQISDAGVKLISDAPYFRVGIKVTIFVQHKSILNKFSKSYKAKLFGAKPLITNEAFNSLGLNRFAFHCWLKQPTFSHTS